MFWFERKLWTEQKDTQIDDQAEEVVELGGGGRKVDGDDREPVVDDAPRVVVVALLIAAVEQNPDDFQSKNIICTSKLVEGDTDRTLWDTPRRSKSGCSVKKMPGSVNLLWKRTTRSGSWWLDASETKCWAIQSGTNVIKVPKI